MDRREAAIAANIKGAMLTNGVSLDTLSLATDIPAAELDDLLSGKRSFLVQQLSNVGGFFRTHPEAFMRSAA